MGDDRRDLEAELRRLIPLAEAMALEVAELSPGRLVLSAPLPPNRNHAGTAFAGSLYALAALAGWGLLRHTVRQAGLAGDLLLGEGTIRYRRPLAGTLRAEASLPSADRDALLARVRGERSARLELAVALGTAAAPEALFYGRYFARPARDR